MDLYFLLAFSIFLVFGTFIPYVPITHWSIRSFDFVKVQLLALCLLCTFAWIYYGPEGWLQWAAFVALLASMVHLFSKILPYSPFHYIESHHSSESETLSLIVANVLQTNERKKDLLQIIENQKPDFFLTMETDLEWERSLNTLQKEYPHAIKVPLDNMYGMHFYSKIELIDPQVKYLVQDDIPSIHVTVCTDDQKQIKIICIHPTPPSPTENETSIERDAELMIVGKMVRASEEDTIVCGDFNDVAWSKTSVLFKRMTGLLDPRVGRGPFPTFHAKYYFLRFPLDHLFHSPTLGIKEIKRLPYYGSDHFAMWYSFAFKKEENVEYVDTHLDQEDKVEIEDIIEKAE